MSVTIPPYLEKGNTIGLICPSGFMPYEKAQACIKTLREWEFNVKPGKTLGSKSLNYFAGDDDERLKDLQKQLDDPTIEAILCARGGYGLSRIIDRVNFKKFRKRPKWIIGFSDITILHAHIYSNYRIATMHGPMANAFNDGESDNIYLHALKDGLMGKRIIHNVTPNELNRKGEGRGELVGGNLALLAHIIGTSSDIKTKGRILVLEDVGEYLYNIDRMLYQLKRNGKLAKLAGLVVGGFTDNKDTERPFGKSVQEIILDAVQEYEYPVCFDFPVSHDLENYTLKLGLEYQLTVGEKVVLKEK